MIDNIIQANKRYDHIKLFCSDKDPFHIHLCRFWIKGRARCLKTAGKKAQTRTLLEFLRQIIGP